MSAQIHTASLDGPRPNLLPVRRALLSVSNKQGLIDLARGLHRLGIELVSTGGTQKAIAEAGIPVRPVEELTQFPEMLDGRVKTLHPAVHAGLLARRDHPAHLEALAQAGYGAIDLLVVNLYPFREALAQPGVSHQTVVENIDIGGPAMLRAAAKNHDGVAVLVDPNDYDGVLASLQSQQGQLAWAQRAQLAAKAFAHTAAYDGAIANFLTGLPLEETQATGQNSVEPPAPARRSEYPAVLSLQFQRQEVLRYGENPHQSAALYRDPAAPVGSLATARQLQGKALSYNNLADADAAWGCVCSFAEPACTIVKHANPCGVAQGADSLEAYRRAFSTDPTSAFGGILAFNRPVDRALAEAIAGQFAEVILAPAFSPEALAVFSAKANLRLLDLALPSAGVPPLPELKRISGGLLVQSADTDALTLADLRQVTEKAPTPEQLRDLLFAWKVAAWVKSNAIVFCHGGMTVGVGAGQMSRLDSARIAAIKAGHAGLSLAGSVVASDAFFPFRDGLDVVADAGAVAVIQPGGSMRDDEVIAAANERGIAMVFAGVRHFRH